MPPHGFLRGNSAFLVHPATRRPPSRDTTATVPRASCTTSDAVLLVGHRPPSTIVGPNFDRHLHGNANPATGTWTLTLDVPCL